MRNSLVFLILLFSLNACSYFHVRKMDIEQGNILTEGTLSKIHRGMSKEQVIDKLGEPLLTNVFNPNRMDYVYTYKPGYDPGTRKYITLLFRGNMLVDIKSNLYSQYVNDDETQH